MSEKYIAILKNIEPVKYQITRVMDNWFYPNSLKCMLLRKFISIYREYVSIIEEHYEHTKEPEVLRLLDSSIKTLREFDVKFNEIYMDSIESKLCC